MWNIINFEVLRALKKKSFWIASIAPLVLILVVIGIEYFSAKSAESNAAQQAQAFSASAKIGEFDDSGLVSQPLALSQHVAVEPSEDAGVAAVKSGKLDAFFYYPKDLSTMDVEVYAQDTGISLSPPYNAAASQLLKQSVINDVSAATKNTQVVQLLEKPSRGHRNDLQKRSRERGICERDRSRNIRGSIPGIICPLGIIYDREYCGRKRE